MDRINSVAEVIAERSNMANRLTRDVAVSDGIVVNIVNVMPENRSYRESRVPETAVARSVLPADSAAIGIGRSDWFSSAQCRVTRLLNQRTNDARSYYPFRAVSKRYADDREARPREALNYRSRPRTSIERQYARRFDTCSSVNRLTLISCYAKRECPARNIARVDMGCK